MGKNVFSPGLNRIVQCMHTRKPNRIAQFVCVMFFIGMSSLSAKPDQKLTIRNHKGTLSEFFKEIEKQSDYRFFYNDELVSIEKEVYQLDVNNKSVDEVLTSLLAYTGLRYKKLDNNLIVISTMELLENVNVTGSVTDAAGEPVIGANVVVKGSTTIGTTTDADGNFTLSVPNDDAVLVFSYIGYTTQEVRVGRQRTFRIVLQEDDVALEEVVVVAYGTARKKDLTGAISTIDAKSITAQSISTVSRALEGAVAGLQVSSVEGQPGVDMKIRVRGVGSTNEASSYALVVIDGVPAQVDNVLATINPNDIAGVTVLKDAASTALYGSRGANGVVLITTKKGTSGKAKITLDTRWGVNSMTNNMPDLVRDPATIYEHMWQLIYNTYRYSDGKLYQNNGYKNNVQNPLHTHEEAALYASQHLFNYTGNSASLTRNDLGNWMLYSFPGWNDASNYEITGSGDSQSATLQNNYLVGTDGRLNPAAQLMYNDTYYDILLKNRLRQEYNLSASGGNDKMDYHISFGVLDDPSYISISKFERYTGRAVVNGKITDWFKMGANVGYSHRLTSGQTARYGGDNTTLYQNRGDAQENIFAVVNRILPIIQVYARDKNGNYVLNADGSKKTIAANGDSYSPLGPTSTGGNSNDVVYRMENDKAEVLSRDISARTYAEVKFLNDFTFTANLSTDATFSQANNYRNGVIGRAANYGGALYRQNGTYVNLNTQQLLNWNRNFGKHHAEALLGHEYNEYTFDVIRFSSTRELIAGYDAYANFVGRYEGGIGYPTPGGNESKLTMESYFARANYIYDDKYGLSASLRRDGSSKFKYADDRWGTFWSVGGSWRLSHEKFIREATSGWLNNLKVRASYGVIGNQNGIGTYGGYQTWSYGARYTETTSGTGTPASYTVSPGSFVNEHLTWENIHTTDIGV
ncbi:MAG: SusC/RagA family TonB-linked outer membrane protein, partial [Tannerella sp.]|nr:SusC/RagA family TonB-linked outer membrane protein [Tannerella sp.]